MRSLRSLCLGLAIAAMAGCELLTPNAPPPARSRTDPGGPTPKPQYVPAPTLTPSPLPTLPPDWPTREGGTGTYVQDWSAPSASLADWKDPTTEGYSFPWLYSGSWGITNAAPILAAPLETAEPEVMALSRSARALEFNDMRPQPALSFRRYAGKAFGTPDGELPERYRATVTVTPLAAREDFYPPVGDQGTPVYYLDPTHYIEVLIKPEKFEVWECNGGEPLKWRGWRQLYDEDASHSAGVGVALGAEVDSRNGTLRIYHGQRMVREVKSPIVKPYTHYFALRAGSNRVQFTNLMIASE